MSSEQVVNKQEPIYIWENQRLNSEKVWADPDMPGDPSPWSNFHGQKMEVPENYVKVSPGEWEYSKTSNIMFSSWHSTCFTFDQVRRREWRLEKVNDEQVKEVVYKKSIKVDKKLIEWMKEYDRLYDLTWNGGDVNDHIHEWEEQGEKILLLIRKRMGLSDYE